MLRGSVMSYRGRSVGTVAACDPAGAVAANYHECFVRHFIPSAHLNQIWTVTGYIRHSEVSRQAQVGWYFTSAA
ncbi:MAG: glycoside hydrolase 100 family protein [Pseudomonadota bacterium]|nr:glycoside hydrolase 100 family protein [Pseudomonadota bacterium]